MTSCISVGLLRKLEGVIEKLPEMPRGAVTAYVREDRDSS